MTFSPNTPITQENVGLLKAGDIVSLHVPEGKTKRGIRPAKKHVLTVDRVTQTHIKFTDGGGWNKENGFDPLTFLSRPALAKPAEGEVDSGHGSVYDRLLTFIHDRDDALRGDDRTDPNEIDETVLAIMRIATPTPPSVDWERVGPKLVEALEANAGLFEDLAAGAEVTGRPAMAASARLFAQQTRAALAATQPKSNGD